MALDTYGFQVSRHDSDWFTRNPMGWAEINEEAFPEERAERIREALHKKGIETKKAFLGLGENYIYVHPKDFARAKKIIKEVI